MAELAAIPTERICRFCGCTPDAPCKVRGGDECAYVYRSNPLRCNAPACEAAFARERRLEWRRELDRAQMLREMREKGKRQKKGRNRQRRVA